MANSHDTKNKRNSISRVSYVVTSMVKALDSYVKEVSSLDRECRQMNCEYWGTLFYSRFFK